MKITIRFQHSDSKLYPCAAIVDTETRKDFCCSLSETWAEAEAEAIQKAKAQLDAGEPPQEKVIDL